MEMQAPVFGCEAPWGAGGSSWIRFVFSRGRTHREGRTTTTAVRPLALFLKSGRVAGGAGTVGNRIEDRREPAWRSRRRSQASADQRPAYPGSRETGKSKPAICFAVFGPNGS